MSPTSGLNRLVKSDSGEEIIERLVANYCVPITETSIPELSGTQNAKNRKALADACEQLLRSGYCLLPHQDVMHKMADCFRRRKERFDWAEVDIEAGVLAGELRAREFLSDDRLAAQSRAYAKAQKKSLKQIFDEARERFKHDFPNGSQEMRLEEFIRLYRADGGPFWKSVSGFYERTNLFPIDENEARAFIARCPPYHAIVLGIAIAHYQYGIARSTTAEFDAGPFDLFMAVYLPYADYFVTDDPGQANVMRAIAAAVGIPVKVSRYDDFVKQMVRG